MIGSKERNATLIDRKLNWDHRHELSLLLDTNTYTQAKSQCLHYQFQCNDQLS